MAHAKKSPSAAVRWMTCSGSNVLSEGIEDPGSGYAAEGTAAHELAERILKGADGKDLIGKKAENGIEFTADMLTEVLKYVTTVRDLVASTGGTLLVEQRLSIEHLTGEADAHGTSDCVILADSELIVGDLKFGRGERVDAEENHQLMIYALAALEKFGKEQQAKDDMEDLL